MKKQLMIAAGLLLLVAGATAIFLQLPGETRAAGNTYYVSTTGNDANACTPNDLSKAKRTIQQGVLCAQAGETVMVKAGTYTENVTNWRSGSAGSPITVKAASGETVNWISPTGAPTLGNPGAALTCQVRINDRSYIRIEGFIFRDSAASCVIRVLQTGGIAGKTSTPIQGIEIINNTFINNGGPRTDTGYMSRQIYLQYIGRDANYTGGTVNLIQGNTFQNNYGAGIDFDNSSDIRVVSNISTGALENKNDSNVN